MAIYFFRGILVTFAFCGSITFASAQTITAGKDSVVVPTAQPADTAAVGILGGLKKWDKPSRAALYSTIIPGGGQFYNKRYWKIPIIYAGVAIIGYLIVDLHKNYLLYRSSYEVLTDGKPATIDRFVTSIPDPVTRARTLVFRRDTYRRYRDLNIVFAAVLYGLQIGEAYIDAHLKGFDVSDELSLRVEPTILSIPTYMSHAPGISVRLNFKK